jgi:5-methylcytosine-specific restriction endonuclease McrA
MAAWPYSSPLWKAVRLAVLERDGYRCQIRGPKCTGMASHVDHVIDWRDGGAPFDPSNLRAACASDNIAKRNRGVAARARAARGEAGALPYTPSPSRDW